MREYEFNIDKSLGNCLSPTLVTPQNAPFMSKVVGFRCGDLGLEPYVLGTNPLPSALDIQYSWPFPQVLEGEKFLFLIVRDNINEADQIYVINYDNTVTWSFTIDKLTFGQGGLYELADFGEYAILSNGLVYLYWHYLGSWNVTKVASATLPLMTSVCNYKGRLIGGNVTSTWHDCNENYYIWSKIGSVDFTVDQSNEAGYRRDPMGGEILNIRRMQDIIVGCSTHGITYMFPANQSIGFKEVCHRGIANKGAIAGHLNEYLVVGEDYIVRKLTPEGVEDVGYQRQMLELKEDEEDVIVNFDDSRDDFYIGNSQRTFLLSSKGMTEIKQHPSALWINAGIKHLLPATEDSQLYELLSESFNFGYGGQKTISTMETDAVGYTDCTIGVQYSEDNKVFTERTYSEINKQGLASVPISGVYFKAGVRFETVDSDFATSYIKLRFKMTDLRGIRGVYAPAPRGQE